MDPDDEYDDYYLTHCCFCDVLLGSWDDEDPDGAACNSCYKYYSSSDQVSEIKK